MKTCLGSVVPQAITLTALIMIAPTPALAGKTALGQFDGNTDVGFPEIAGTAAYDAARQEYTLTGSGTNMWGPGDQFQFLWKQMRGDFILRARLQFAGKGAEGHRKTGWMIRPSLDPQAPYVDCAEHGDGHACLQYRRSAGAKTEDIVLATTNADVIQLERRGNTYVFSAARFGEPFVSAEISDIALPDNVYAGLFICSHNGKVAEKALFRDVRLIRPAKQDFVPYHDYIGCNLEILDVRRGELKLIHSSAVPFEAPNWTRDGKALIYNVSGRAAGWGAICRFDLATKTSTVIDTGLARQNNNDHVLSFDGTMLGLSDQSAGHGGQSAVFTVPVGGGMPTRITPLTPSYLHGWSPDGKFLVYTGLRNGQSDIYRIPAVGGEEVRLTDSAGKNDGAEYTPDGKHIYFNSTRSGKMQIWRMNSDGKEPQRVTHDDYNNWFPHISPDGKWIAFLSFPADIDPGDHPYYKHVYLRLMPVAGGAPRIVAYIYGGQGTMNVPSWSPDSRNLAFVSNTAIE